MFWKILIMKTILLILRHINFQKRDYHGCLLKIEEATIQHRPVCKIKLEAWAKLKVMMYAAQIVRNEVISCKKLIKYSETALIFVNFLIDATWTANTVKLFGKQWMNFKNMLFLNVQSLDVISATMRISKRWRELNFLNILNTIVQK